MKRKIISFIFLIIFFILQKRECQVYSERLLMRRIKSVEAMDKIYTYLGKDSAQALLKKLKLEIGQDYLLILSPFAELLEKTFFSTKNIILKTTEGKKWMKKEGIKNEDELECRIKEKFLQKDSMFLTSYIYGACEQIIEYQDPKRVLILFHYLALKVNEQTKTTVAFTGFSPFSYLLYLSEKGTEIDEEKLQNGLSKLLASLPPERIFQEYILGDLIVDLYFYTSLSGAMDEFINLLPVIEDIRTGTQNWGQEHIAAYLYTGLRGMRKLAKNFSQFKKGIQAIKELYQALLDEKLDSILLEVQIRYASYLLGRYPGLRIFSNLSRSIEDFETFLQIIKKATEEAKAGRDPAHYLESIN